MDYVKKYNINQTEYIKPFSGNLIYDPNGVVEGNKNINKLICPICYNIFKEPYCCNSTKISHSFCKERIIKSLEKNDKCSMC